MSTSDDEESGVLPVDETPPSNAESVGKSLTVIWDDDKIEKYTDTDGKQHWKCLWCGRTFQYWNATKALFHVNKESGGAVRSCSSTKIDDTHKAEYRRLFNKLTERKSSLANLVEGKKRSSDEYIGTATNCTPLQNERKLHLQLPPTPSLPLLAACQTKYKHNSIL